MNKFIFFIVCCFSVGINAQDIHTFFSKTNTCFETHVLNGKVAYTSILDNPESLDDILALAKDIKVSKSDPNTYQAFWINAYNLATIKGIISNYPINSPLDNLGFFDKTTYNLGGRSITLNDIENKLLRANFKDPRFHFVLVCGAVGCPPLISEAYMPNTLNEQLETQTIKAINGNFIKVNSKKRRVEGSEILKWYKEDFVLNGNEIEFLNIYRTEKEDI